MDAFLSYSAKTNRDGGIDGRTDGRGCCNISSPGPLAWREIIMNKQLFIYGPRHNMGEGGFVNSYIFQVKNA